MAKPVIMFSLPLRHFLVSEWILPYPKIPGLLRHAGEGTSAIFTPNVKALDGESHGRGISKRIQASPCDFPNIRMKTTVRTRFLLLVALLDFLRTKFQDGPANSSLVELVSHGHACLLPGS